MPLSRVAAAVVAAIVVIGGSVALAVSDGPPAYRVGTEAFSQSSVDAELEALATNKLLADLIEANGAQPLASTTGSVTSDLGASWVGLRIVQEMAEREIARQDLEATKADRAIGHTFATQSVGGEDVFKSLPEQMQRDLDRRWLALAVVDRQEAECPSGYVSHILVSSEADAQELSSRLAAGADFERLARQFSQDTGSASNGGHLGCLDELGDLDPDFLSAVETLDRDVVSDPVQTQFGFHLIVVTDERFAFSPSDSTLSALRSRARHVHVEVDSKYGTWDQKNGQVLPPGVSAQG